MIKNILAKSQDTAQNIKKQTLIEHTEDLIEVLEKINYSINFANIDKKLFNESKNNFNNLLMKVCIIHDLGKINEKFQKKIELANDIDELKIKKDKNNNDTAELKNKNEQYSSIKDKRHNILTGAFLKTIFSELNVGNDIIPILYKAILLHHGNYEKYLAISNRDIERAVLTDIEDGIFLKDEYDYKQVENFINEKLNINIKFDENFLDYEFMYQLNEDFRDNRDLQHLYIVLKGFLNLIDHLASSQIKDFNYFIPLSKEEIDYKLLEQISKKTKQENIKFRTMQEKTREYIENNVLTEAFTGSGKTVADYRWYGKRKFFLVPNKISAESFYCDAEEILGTENIGILHGDISLYVEDENSETNGEGLKITLRDKILARNFAKSYVIATVDQLLLSMFKYPGYEKVFASVYDSCITVDEVHLLDPRMFLILIYFIQFTNKNLQTKFHLMTATLPKIYKEKLNECNIEFLESNKNELVEENKKICLQIIKDEEKELKKIINEALKANSKILIIRNTVDKAIQTLNFICKEYKNCEVNLLHSRFKFEDKKQKYKDILDQKGQIWVSTQSVEISLDLDFQVVISDNAPMESIIQRMGRNNRHDKLEYGLFYVTDNCDKDVYEKEVKSATLSLLKKHNKKILSMKDRKELLVNYYEVNEVKKYYEKGFKEAEEIIRNIYGLKSAELNGENLIFNYEPYLNIVDNKKEASKLFRDTEINAKVLLQEDYEDLQSKNANFKEYQLKSIQISEGYYRRLVKYNMLIHEEGYLIIKNGYYNYNSSAGLQLKDNKVIQELEIEDRYM